MADQGLMMAIPALLKAQQNVKYPAPGAGGQLLPVVSRPLYAGVLLALMFLNALLLQFVFLSFDNNTLLSWQWIMPRETFFLLFFLAALSLYLLYKPAVFSVSEKTQLSILLVLSGMIAMLSWSMPEYLVDSARYFAHAKVIATQGLGYFFSEWGGAINPWTDLPLPSVIYGLCFSVVGEYRLAIQVVGALFFVGSVYLCYLLAGLLWGHKTGIHAGLLLLAIPYLHVQSSQMLSDVPAMFLSLLALYVTVRALKQGGRLLFLTAGFVCALAVLSKFSVWLVLASMVVLPWALPGEPNIAVKRLLTVAAVGALLLLPLYIHYSVVIQQQLFLIRGFQLPALGGWGESFVSTFFYQVHPAVTVLAVMGLVVSIYRKSRAMLLPVTVFVAVFAFGGHRSRYLLIVMPMLALMAAYGLHVLRAVQLRDYVARAAMIIAILITLVSSLDFLRGYSANNLKHAASFVQEQQENQVAVMVLPRTPEDGNPGSELNPAIMLPLLDYYTGKEIVVLDHEAAGNVGNKKFRPYVAHPLRFTWEVDNYSYQKAALSQLDSGSLLLVIADGLQSMPDNIQQTLSAYQQVADFSQLDNVFLFQPVVYVFRHKANLPAYRKRWVQ